MIDCLTRLQLGPVSDEQARRISPDFVKHATARPYDIVDHEQWNLDNEDYFLDILSSKPGRLVMVLEEIGVGKHQRGRKQWHVCEILKISKARERGETSFKVTNGTKSWSLVAYEGIGPIPD